jgi:chromosome segregation ATPase
MKTTVLFVSLCLAGRAQSPPAPSDSSVIQALLSEVHQLRLALERSNTIGPRIQLAVERVKLQQPAVTRLSEQLESVRRDLERAQPDEARFVGQIKAMETELSQTVDPAARNRMESTVKEMQIALEQGQKVVAALRSREAELSARLQTEQATLDGLNDRLSQIERALSQ